MLILRSLLVWLVIILTETVHGILRRLLIQPYLGDFRASITLGHFIFGYPWSRLLQDYNISQGGLLGLGMIFLTLSPAIAAKVRSY